VPKNWARRFGSRTGALATMAFNLNKFSEPWGLGRPNGMARQLPITAGMMLNLNYRTELIELGCKNWWPARDHESAGTKSAGAVHEQHEPAAPRFCVPSEYALFVIELA